MDNIEHFSDKTYRIIIYINIYICIYIYMVFTTEGLSEVAIES